MFYAVVFLSQLFVSRKEVGSWVKGGGPYFSFLL